MFLFVIEHKLDKIKGVIAKLGRTAIFQRDALEGIPCMDEAPFTNPMKMTVSQLTSAVRNSCSHLRRRASMLLQARPPATEDIAVSETHSIIQGTATQLADGALAARLLHIQQRKAADLPGSKPTRSVRNPISLFWLWLPASLVLVLLGLLVSKLLSPPDETSPSLATTDVFAGRLADIESSLDLIKSDNARLNFGLNYSLDQIQDLYQRVESVSLELHSVRMRDSQWLQERDPGNYSIQLVGARSRENLLQFANQHAAVLNGAPIFLNQSRFKEQIWFSLYVGDYSSRESATRAMQALPEALQRNQPWLRKIGSIRGDTIIANTTY